jgi:hypothetical protein
MFKPAHHSQFKKGVGLEGVNKLISLGTGTCARRAAEVFRTAHDSKSPEIKILEVSAFQDAVLQVIVSSDAAMLVPHLHPLQRRLAQKGHFEELSGQRFSLTNPALHLATPENPLGEHRLLFALPALLFLMEELEIKLDEVVPVNSTQAAAEQCGKIFGAGLCITNESGLSRFNLKSLIELPRVDVTWSLYKKKTK